MLAYLSGAIEQAPDLGRTWRANLTPLLTEMGFLVYDPALDARKNLTEEEAVCFRKWKKTNLVRFQEVMRKIISYDLELVSQSDLVIAYWDEHATRGAGTQAELTLAHRAGIPVHLVTAMPHHEVSGWVLGCANQVFTSFAELTAFLKSNTVADTAAAASQG